MVSMVFQEENTDPTEMGPSPGSPLYFNKSIIDRNANKKRPLENSTVTQEAEHYNTCIHLSTTNVSIQSFTFLLIYIYI